MATGEALYIYPGMLRSAGGLSSQRQVMVITHCLPCIYPEAIVLLATVPYRKMAEHQTYSIIIGLYHFVIIL